MFPVSNVPRINIFFIWHIKTFERVLCSQQHLLPQAKCLHGSGCWNHLQLTDIIPLQIYALQCVCETGFLTLMSLQWLNELQLKCLPSLVNGNPNPQTVREGNVQCSWPTWLQRQRFASFDWNLYAYWTQTSLYALITTRCPTIAIDKMQRTEQHMLLGDRKQIELHCKENNYF